MPKPQSRSGHGLFAEQKEAPVSGVSGRDESADELGQVLQTCVGQGRDCMFYLKYNGKPWEHLNGKMTGLVSSFKRTILL